MNNEILENLTWQDAVNLCNDAIDGIGDCGYVAGREKEKLGILRRIENCKREGGKGSSVFIIGDNGTGKTTLVKNILDTVMDELGDIVCYITIEGGCRERFHGAGARVLYSKFVNGLSVRTKRKGGALEVLLQGFIRKVQEEMGAQPKGTDASSACSLVEACMKHALASTEGDEVNTAFAQVVSLYISGVTSRDEALRFHALKWLKGEYESKQEVRLELGHGVGIFISDRYAMAMIKNWIRLFSHLGKTTVVAFDEIQRLVRLDEATAQGNWAVIKDLYDCSKDLRAVFLFSGTTEVKDKYNRKGLFSNRDLSDRLGGPGRNSGRVNSFDDQLIELAPVSDPNALLEYLTFLQGAKEKAIGGGFRFPVTEKDIQDFLRKEKQEHEGYDAGRMADEEKIFVKTRVLKQDFMRALSAMADNPGLGFAAACGHRTVREDVPVKNSIEVL